MTGEEQVILIKQMSENAREAGFYKGLLEGVLANMHEDPAGDLYTIDVEVVEKVRKLMNGGDIKTDKKGGDLNVAFK